MKMNKKYAYSFAVLFAVAMVSASIGYYNSVQQEISIESPIVVAGVTPILIDGFSGESIDGEEITITNVAKTKLRSLEVLITNDASEDINVEYIGTLELTKKTVNFSENSAPWVIGSEKVQVEYTVVGNSFNAEVIDANGETEYVLIYYADAVDRFANPEEAILVEGNNFPYLPYLADMNSENQMYNYCDTGEYDTCYGAKIWYVPSDAINNDKTLDWSRASEFYFETELIQYNPTGNITVYDSLEITPVYTADKYFNGSETITTTIA